MRIKEAILILLISLPTLSNGQVENKWQPDSVYIYHNVKKILVYLNSPKDLSEIVEFDKTGKRIRSTKYSASYNRRTRKNKWIEKVQIYNYDSYNRLISIMDSVGTDSIIYQYGTDNRLISSRKNLGNFVYYTEYFSDPLRATTTRMKDSMVVYEKTKEYEYDIYVKRFYGYYFEPKLKKDTIIVNKEISITSYSDHNNLQRFEDDETIKNIFNSDGRLLESEIRSMFMNDRLNEYELHYTYYKNGLLRSIRGYVPRYFEYEFWE